MCKLVDTELGYAVGLSARHKSCKVFLYISQQKRVIGCVIAEEITEVRVEELPHQSIAVHMYVAS